MARQRFIWPTIWSDPVIARMKPEEMLLYIACFSLADDEGRLLGEVDSLRATAFMYAGFSQKKVKTLRDGVLSKQNHLVLYVVENVEYLAFLNWTEHQKPKYPSPSKHPDPPDDSGNGSGNDSPNGDGTLGEGSSAGRDGLGWVGKEEVKGRTAVSNAARTALPEEKQREVLGLLKAIGGDAEDGSSTRPSTLTVLTSLAAGLPQGSIAKVRESLELKTPPPANRAAYAVGALKDEKAEQRLQLLDRADELRNPETKGAAA